jgi:hypothetical protein
LPAASVPRYSASEAGVDALKEQPEEGPAPHAPGTLAAGKYLHIEVPGFDDPGTGAGTMTSYLHLGAVREPAIAASPAAPPSTGEDLASRVTSFIDDTRMRDGCPDFVPVAERQAETAKLHYKGGIRDHTDGNRITTTRGDKVEVIKGNYRMVVLGRQEDASGWDVSGGHVAQNGITFSGGGYIDYTTAEYGGCWRVHETVVKGDVTSFYQGKQRDTYWGEEVTSVTGSESPTEARPNPVKTERTWAEQIASYTGSAALPVPKISDETWAEVITSTTNAASVTDTTTAGAITSTTTAASIVDTTTAGAVVSTTIGNVLDTTIGTSTSLILGAETEVIVGDSMEINIGAEESVSLGAAFELTLGVLVDVTLAASVSVDIGPSLEIEVDLAEEEKGAREHSEEEVARVSGEEAKVSGAYSVVSEISLLG